MYGWSYTIASVHIGALQMLRNAIFLEIGPPPTPNETNYKLETFCFIFTLLRVDLYVTLITLFNYYIIMYYFLY